MSKAIAIAATKNSPFEAALESLKNSGQLVIDFMYGTPERTRFTYAFAVGLAILGFVLDSMNGPLQSCPV